MKSRYLDDEQPPLIEEIMEFLEDLVETEKICPIKEESDSQLQDTTNSRSESLTSEESVPNQVETQLEQSKFIKYFSSQKDSYNFDDFPEFIPSQRIYIPIEAEDIPQNNNQNLPEVKKELEPHRPERPFIARRINKPYNEESHLEKKERNNSWQQASDYKSCVKEVTSPLVGANARNECYYHHFPDFASSANPIPHVTLQGPKADFSEFNKLPPIWAVDSIVPPLHFPFFTPPPTSGCDFVPLTVPPPIYPFSPYQHPPLSQPMYDPYVPSVIPHGIHVAIPGFAPIPQPLHSLVSPPISNGSNGDYIRHHSVHPCYPCQRSVNSPPIYGPFFPLPHLIDPSSQPMRTPPPFFTYPPPIVSDESVQCSNHYHSAQKPKFSSEIQKRKVRKFKRVPQPIFSDTDSCYSSS